MNIPRKSISGVILILKMLAETLIRIPFAVIGRYSLVPTSDWLEGKYARIRLPQVASSVILQNPRRLPVSIFSVKIATLGYLKRDAGRILKLSNQAETLSLIFFTNLETRNCKNYRRITYLQYYKPSKKVIS
jgi:hypothetical protein